MAKQKAQIPTVAASSLTVDVREAITTTKNTVRTRLPGKKQVFANSPPVLPNLDDGCEYFEFDVGAAHAGEMDRPRGRRRLVVEVVKRSRQVREIYFTDSHYTSGTFRRVRN
jgi:guanyl-specific ribonuclease Sa